MANTKLSAFFSLLLVFCSGAVVGVFGYRVYNTSKVAPPARAAEKQDPEIRRKQLIDETTRDINLDPSQVAKLGKIYDDTREQFEEWHKKMNAESHAIWEDQIAKIKAMLRPDQVELYDKLRARKDAERKQRSKGGPTGKDRKD